MSVLSLKFHCILTSISAEGVDYVLSHPIPLRLTNMPVPVTVSLLNDGVNGEGIETITLTLVEDQSESNRILVYDTVNIFLQDFNSK